MSPDNALGVSGRRLRANDRAWVLAHLSMEIEQLPDWEVEVVVETWPSGLEGLHATREFVLRADGAPVLRASSAWLVFDLEKRRPARPPGPFATSSFRIVLPPGPTTGPIFPARSAPTTRGRSPCGITTWTSTDTSTTSASWSGPWKPSRRRSMTLFGAQLSPFNSWPRPGSTTRFEPWLRLSQTGMTGGLATSSSARTTITHWR